MKNDAAPNPPKPKRPPGSFLVFMEDHFRNEYSLKNPNQPAGFASQAGAKQWKQMKDDEKAPFQRKAKELALEYFEKKRCYNNIESQEVNPLPEDVHMHSHEDPQAAPIAGAPPRRLRRRHIPVVPSSSPSPPLTVLVASMTSPSSSPQSCRAKTDAARSSDPNPQKPKRRPGSFLVFMEHFRKEFNLRNPGQPAWVSSQAGAEKWKQMKQDEKTPFQRKARELAVEYFQKKDCYNNPESQGVNPLTPGSESVQMHKDKEGALPQGHDGLMSGSEGMQIHTDEGDAQAQAAPPRPAAAMTCFWLLRPPHTTASTSATMASMYDGASCEHVEDCSSVSLWSNLQHEEELSGPEASPESVKPRRQSLRDTVDGGGAAKLMINKRRRRMFG